MTTSGSTPSTAPEQRRSIIPVAAGCLFNDAGEVLICQRPPGKVAAGKWEFPGGKIEAGETPEEGLTRELHEELGVQVEILRPLLRIPHHYRDRSVLLHVWQVKRFTGQPYGRDGQALAWVRPEDLRNWDLLAADWPIVTALCLPSFYVFTPPDLVEPKLIAGLDGLPPGALLRLRLPELAEGPYRRLAERLQPLCQARGLRLMTDRSLDMARELATGWHATDPVLRQLHDSPAARGLLCAASVHDIAGLERAADLGFDFAVLGPVRPTATHPGTRTLEWRGFSEMLAGGGDRLLPVYAIGGLTPDDLASALQNGAQGLAGISAFW